MPKRRPTIPIAHADDVPTIAFTDEQWQAIEQAYGRQLNADVRQQITIVTIQYLKDIDFDRTTAPKEMALKRIKRVRRQAGDLERVMFDREAFSAASDELSRQQQQSAHSYADGLIRRHLAGGDVLSENRKGVSGVPAIEEEQGNWDKLHHFRDALKSLIVACDCALNDLSAVEYRDDDPWDWWIQGLTRIATEHGLPYYARIDASEKPSPFVALVRALQEHVPARHMSSDGALAKAIQRAQDK